LRSFGVDVKSLVNGKPVVTVGVCVVVMVAGFWVAMRRSTPKVTSVQSTGEYYFSADDGATWKAFSPWSLPPFENGGKTWVRAHVFKCGSEAAKVGYLEQYPPAVKERLASMEGNRGVLSEALSQLETRGSLVKKPGDKEWVVRDPYNSASTAITEVMCGGEKAKEVLP
jgi:hypothetical protein